MSPNILQSDMLDPPALSDLLRGVPLGTLAQWRYLGKGPRYVKAGKHVLYRRADVEAWLDEHTVGGDA